LYNKKGRASSVKWIADIRIPPLKIDTTTPSNSDVYFYPANHVRIKRYYIKFTVKNIPENCSGYQIVQCPRTISDRHVISQGIVGRPLMEYVPNSQHEFEPSNNICPSGLMTLQDMFCESFYPHNKHGYPLESTEGTKGLVPNFVDNDWDSGNFNNGRTASSVQDIIQFASPEYAYQSDDIKDIIDAYKSSIKLEHVISYETPGNFVDHSENSGVIYNESLFSGTSSSWYYTDHRYTFASFNQQYNSTPDDMAFRFKLYP